MLAVDPGQPFVGGLSFISAEVKGVPGGETTEE
jgi:hypothetical protein